ncbi:MAG TPA: heme-binding protein [Verrucomicrobiae bacterium]|jgi:uncharacterized protein GlcG (DUF336 family)
MKMRIHQLFCLLLAAPVLAAAPVPPQFLASNDVAIILSQALVRGNCFITNHWATNGVVAVVDREGFVLGACSFRPNPSALDLEDAITKAGTAAFLSSDQDAFTSRTAGYIVQQHFPPAINNTANGPLVGVNFSSMSISDVNRFKDPHTFDPGAWGGGGTNGAPIGGPVALSGLNGAPGGVPLYKAGQLVGGVGVTVRGRFPIPELADIQRTAGQTYDTNEDVSLAGQTGYAPSAAIRAAGVLINGIRIPYVNSTTRTAKPVPLASLGFGAVVLPYEITNPPAVHYPQVTWGGVPGEIRQPVIADPLGQFTSNDVAGILTLSAQRAYITRAGIRLPIGQSAEVFITVVNNPNTDTNAIPVTPAVLGTFRVGRRGFTNDATIFSWDVAVQKARTALYYSSDEHAYSVRAIGFMAQVHYPPGIGATQPGPLFSLQEKFSLLPAGVMNPLNGVLFTAGEALSAPAPGLPNGITIFPGGFPLYRNGKLIGAIGVSGDGVDQDDLIAASGTVNFLAPAAIRSDQIMLRGTRLPYAKFPRNPSL